MQYIEHALDALRQEQSKFPGLPVVPYADFPGVTSENYAAMMGHGPNILLPGLFSVTGIARNAPILDCGNSWEARALSGLEGKEIILVELVPAELVALSFKAMAQAVEGLIVDPANTVISPVLNGGAGSLKIFENLVPILKGIDHQPIKIKRSYGTELGEVVWKQGFGNVDGKRVILVEDLVDQGHTINAAAAEAYALGAINVTTVAAQNKLGVSGKVLLPSLQVVGIGLPDFWVGGGKGPDIRDNFCRNFRKIVAKFTLAQWAEYQAQNGW